MFYHVSVRYTTHNSTLWKDMWAVILSGCRLLKVKSPILLLWFQLSDDLLCYNVSLCRFFRASLEAQMVKNLPAMQETQVCYLDWEDPLKKEIATHYSILAWRTPWTEEPGGLQSTRSQRVTHDWATNDFHFHVDFS